MAQTGPNRKWRCDACTAFTVHTTRPARRLSRVDGSSLAGGEPAVASRGEHVVDEPLAVDLPNRGVADHALADQHLVGRLEDALEVGRVFLGEGDLEGELFEGDAPGDGALGAGDLEQSVQA